MRFAIPRVWREPSNHVTDCYFCMVDIAKYKKPADRSKLVYPDIPSSIAPVPHSDQLPVPTPPAKSLADDTGSSASDSEDLEWHAESTDDPHFPDQNEVDDFGTWVCLKLDQNF
jgi:hypothetical protein